MSPACPFTRPLCPAATLAPYSDWLSEKGGTDAADEEVKVEEVEKEYQTEDKEEKLEEE